MSGLVLEIGANTTQAVAGVKRFGFTIDEVKQQIKGLEGELKSMDAQMLSSRGGKALTNELRLAKTEMKSLEAQAALTGNGTANVFSKAFGQVRQLAYILPGIGIAGIFNVAFDAVSNLLTATKKLNEQEEHLKEIRKDAINDLGKESANVSELVLLLNSENTTKKEKEQILKKLREINPQYFGDLRLEAGLVDKLNVAYQGYLASLAKRAEATVLTKQLEEISSVIIDLEQRGANTNLFNLDIQKNADGTLKSFQKMTKEQQAQDQLNTEYIRKLRDRDKILQQLGLRESALTDDLNIGGVKLSQSKPFVPKFPAIKLPVDLVPRIIDVTAFRQAMLDAFPVTFADTVEKHTNELIDKLAKDLKNHPNAILVEAQLRINKGQELSKLQQELIATGQSIAGFITPAIDNMVQAIGKGQNAFHAFAEGIKQALAGVIAKLLETAAAAAIISVITGGAAAGGTGGLSFIQAFKNIFGGFRAGGGPVSAGSAYVVGENRPEIFVPSTSGRILPSTNLGGITGSARQELSTQYIPILRGTELALMIKRTDKYMDRNV